LAQNRSLAFGWRGNGVSDRGGLPRFRPPTATRHVKVTKNRSESIRPAVDFLRISVLT
jgi:hypothetical protein